MEMRRLIALVEKGILVVLSGKLTLGPPRWKVPVLYDTGVKVPLPTELVEKVYSICWTHWQLSIPLTERKKVRA